uniref:Uncharacterized protein n=1 Tax=Moniliophthora roreri TaxID=221103 RepID=A0A0W0GDP8_MONRR
MSSSITSWIASSADKFKSTFFKAFSYFNKRGTIYSFHIVDNEESVLLFKVGRISWPLEERKTEWDQQCLSKPHIWSPLVPTQNVISDGPEGGHQSIRFDFR